MDEKSLYFNIFDINVIESIFIWVTKIHNNEKNFKSKFELAKNFSLISKQFNQTLQNLKFNFNFFENQILLNYNTYLKLSFIYDEVEKNPFQINYTEEDKIDKSLQCCAKFGFYDLIDLMINFGAFINQTYDNPLYLSCQYGHLKTVKKIISLNIDINLSDRFDNKYLLELAIGSKNIKLVKYLVKKGCYLYQFDVNGDSFLILAVRSRNLEIVKYLVSKQCDLNYQNNSGDTALTRAIKISTIEIIEFLIHQNPDITLKNDENKCALDLAKQRGNKGVIGLLENSQK